VRRRPSTNATSTHIQLDMMLHAEQGMFRMQPQEKTQEDFKFWSTQPMLKLGTKHDERHALIEALRLLLTCNTSFESNKARSAKKMDL